MNIELLLKKESEETALLALRIKGFTNSAYPIFIMKYEVIQATQYPHMTGKIVQL